MQVNTYILSALILTIPWVVMPWNNWARLPKVYFMLYGIMVMTAVWIFQGGRKKFTPNYWLFLLFSWMAFGILWTGFGTIGTGLMIMDGRMKDVTIYEQYVNIYLVGLFLFTFFYAVLQDVQEKTVVKAMIISAVIMAVHGIFQYFKMFLFVGPPPSDWRVSGVMGNPNNYGEHLAICLPLLFLIRRRIVKWISILISLTAIMMSRFLTSFAVGAGLACIPLTMAFYLYMTKNQWRHVFILAIVAAVIIGYPFYKQKAWMSIQNRLMFYNDSYRAYKEMPFNPAFGWGLGFYAQLVPKIERNTENLVLTRAHNEYLQLFMETGLIGLGLFTGLFLSLSRKIWAMRHDKETAAYAACLLAAAQVSFVSFPVHMAPTLLVIFIIYTFVNGRFYGDSQVRLYRSNAS